MQQLYSGNLFQRNGHLSLCKNIYIMFIEAFCNSQKVEMLKMFM